MYQYLIRTKVLLGTDDVRGAIQDLIDKLAPEPKADHTAASDEEVPEPMMGKAPVSQGRRRFAPLRDLIRKRAIDELVAKGNNADDVAAAFDQLEAERAGSDRPIVDWFLNGGWQQILQAVLAILALLKSPAPKAA